MTPRNLLLVAAFAAALGACNKDKPTSGGSRSSDPQPASGAASPFIGTWDCTTNLTTKFTSPPGRADHTGKSALTVTITGDATRLLATGVEANGTSHGCVTKYRTSGSTMTADPSQTCTFKTPGPNGETEDVSSTVDSASANLSGNTYTENIVAHFSNRGARELVAGTITGTQTCTRKN